MKMNKKSNLYLILLSVVWHSDEIRTNKIRYELIDTVIENIKLVNKSLVAYGQQIAELEVSEMGQELNSFSGVFLSRFYDCSSLYDDGYTESGVYSIWLTTGYRFLPIYCDMETRHPRTNKRGWMVIQRRYNGELNFNRTWQEYVDGFGSPHGEYWIGLENIYQLANYTDKLFDGRSLILDLADGSKRREIAYGGLQIFNSTFDYEIAAPYVLSVEQNLEDGLLNSRWKKFTTYDKNNQKVQDFGNCARNTGGGWWFGLGCGWSNLNARYPNKNEKMSKSTIYWKKWREISPNNNALTNVSMKIQ